MHRAPHRPHDPSLPPYTIRAIESQHEYLEAEHIQREVWGIDDLDVVPSANLRAVHHAGGCLLGAFRDDVLIGLAYGFLALPHGEGMSGLGLHSHLLAVRPQARAAGVGRALKWSQRDWALAHGLEWITWTFDPLQARNARLNLEHLGAISATYLRDFYGPLAGPLGGDQPSDRLLALWRLPTRRVVERAEAWKKGTRNGEVRRVPRTAAPPIAAERGLPARTPTSATPATPANPTTFTTPTTPDPTSMGSSDIWIVRGVAGEVDGDPERAEAPPDAPVVRVAVPADVTTMLHVSPERAARWREAVAIAMEERIRGGYTVTGFREGGYVLERDFHE